MLLFLEVSKAQLDSYKTTILINIFYLDMQFLTKLVVQILVITHVMYHVFFPSNLLIYFTQYVDISIHIYLKTANNVNN